MIVICRLHDNKSSFHAQVFVSLSPSEIFMRLSDLTSFPLSGARLSDRRIRTSYMLFLSKHLHLET